MAKEMTFEKLSSLLVKHNVATEAEIQLVINVVADFISSKLLDDKMGCLNQIIYHRTNYPNWELWIEANGIQLVDKVEVISQKLHHEATNIFDVVGVTLVEAFANQYNVPDSIEVEDLNEAYLLDDFIEWMEREENEILHKCEYCGELFNEANGGYVVGGNDYYCDETCLCRDLNIESL